MEMLGVMLDLANLGVDVLRVDAIAFTWKRMGTNCQNQPEAHLLAQLFRAYVSVAAPGVVLKAEAIGPRRPRAVPRRTVTDVPSATSRTTTSSW
ncbi:MAG: hypothetical protein R2713_03585 [Ilumatobacteraceae bacterium]